MGFGTLRSLIRPLSRSFSSHSSPSPQILPNFLSPKHQHLLQQQQKLPVFSHFISRAIHLHSFSSLAPKPFNPSTHTRFTGASCHSLRYTNLTQRVQVHSEALIQGRQSTESAADCGSDSNGCRTEARPDLKTDAQNAVNNNVLFNLKASSRHDLAMIFTCKVCETRSMKTCCRESYEKGVIVVRCGGCNNLHLIADRLGWFGEPGSIEDLLAARGEVLKKGHMDSLNLTLEDLAGNKI